MDLSSRAYNRVLLLCLQISLLSVMRLIVTLRTLDSDVKVIDMPCAVEEAKIPKTLIVSHQHDSLPQFFTHISFDREDLAMSGQVSYYTSTYVGYILYV